MIQQSISIKINEFALTEISHELSLTDIISRNLTRCVNYRDGICIKQRLLHLTLPGNRLFAYIIKIKVSGFNVA